MWSTCSKQEVVPQKTIFSLLWHYTTIFVIDSDHLHCTNRPLTFVLRTDMSTLSRRSECTPFRKNVLNGILRKSNINCTIWLKFCDGSFCTYWLSHDLADNSALFNLKRIRSQGQALRNELLRQRFKCSLQVTVVGILPHMTMAPTALFLHPYLLL